MDLLGYAALGGLERLTIVAGAVIIGYWGYRLYTAEKNAGLVFMGLAVVVLVGALATGGSYLKSVGEGYQMASLPVEPEQADEESGIAEQAESVMAEPAGAAEAAEVAEVAEVETPEPTAAPAEVVEAAPAPVEPPAPSVEEAAEAVASNLEAEAVAESPQRIATGAELGGRIVSVKSENVSLEWSSEEGANGSE